MAQSGRDIRQRIYLAGGDAVNRQLAEMGKAGEDAIQRIDRAAGGSSFGSRLQGFLSRIRSGITGAVEPARERLSEAREETLRFGEGLNRLAENTFPHFREALGLAGGVSVAGFALAIAKAAREVNQLDIASRELGIAPERLQGLAAAANAAGVETEKLFQSLLQLSKQVGQISIDQRNKVLELGADALQSFNGAGAQVLRGVNATAQGTANAVKQAVQQTQNVIVNYDKTASALANRFLKEIIPEAGLQGFAGAIPSQSQAQNFFAQQLQTSEEFRQKARDAGLQVPFKTISELAKNATDSIDDFTKFMRRLGIAVVDFATGKARPLDDILKDYATKFATLENRSIAAAQAARLFGDQYRDIIAVLAKGGDELDRTGADFVKAGLGFNLTQLKLGEELNKAVSRLETSLKGAVSVIALSFGPAALPLINGLTDLIRNNAATIRDWAAGIAQQALPAIRELLAVLGGEKTISQVQTSWLREALKAIVALGDAARLVGGLLLSAFRTLVDLLQRVADLLNAAFGTQLNGEVLAFAAAIFYLVGGFRALAVAIAAAKVAWELFNKVRGGLGATPAAPVPPLGPAAAAAGAAGLGAGVAITAGVAATTAAAVGVARETARRARQGDFTTFNGIDPPTDPFGLQRQGPQEYTPAGQPLPPGGVVAIPSEQAGNGLIDRAYAALKQSVISAGDTIWKWVKDTGKTLADSVAKNTDALKKAVDTSVTILNGGVEGIKATVENGVNVLRGAKPNYRPVEAYSPVGIPGQQGIGGGAQGVGFSGGGGVGGSGFGDTVRAWLTPGEFVHRVAAVRHYGVNFMRRVNSLQLPRFATGGIVLGPPEARYATGGMVAALAGSSSSSRSLTPVHLHMGGDEYPLMGEAEIVDGLAAASRTRQSRALGRSPTWVGGKFVNG
jgi:hypothetical protein